MDKVQMIGKNIILRQPKESDIEDYLKCGRNSEIVRMYGGDTRNLRPLIRESALKWYNNAVNHPYIWHIVNMIKSISISNSEISYLSLIHI